MSKNKLMDAIGGIGDDLIANAKKNRTAIIMWRRIAAAAACLVVLGGAIYLSMPKTEPEENQTIMQNTTVSTSTSTVATVTKPIFVPTTRPKTAPTTRVTTKPTTKAPTLPTTAKTTLPHSSSTKPTNARPTASTTHTFAPTTKPTTSTIISSTTVAPSTGNNSQFAYPPLVITDGEKYTQLFAAAEDVSELIQHQDFMQTFGNQDELKKFVNKLQQLPIPQIEGAVCTILEYIPDYQMLNIALQTPDGVGYSFTFELNKDRANVIREDFAKRNMIFEQEWTVPGCETFKTVTEFKLLYTIFPGHYGCWVEINGWLANFTGTNLPNNIELDDILTQLSFGDTVYWD